MPVRYDATVRTLAAQLVRWAHCNSEYVYQMELAGGGTAPGGDENARKAAMKVASKELKRQIKDVKLCAAVPCPNCFGYQWYMFEEAGKIAYAVEWAVTMALLGLGAVAWLIAAFIARRNSGEAPIPALIGLGLLSLGGLAYLYTKWRIGRYNPNKREAKAARKRLAADKAFTPDEFVKAQTERVRAAYAVHADAARNGARGKKSKEPEPLIVNWWVDPAVLIGGGTISIPVTDEDRVVVDVPADTRTGTLFELGDDESGVVPFQVRVYALRIHPDDPAVD